MRYIVCRLDIRTKPGWFKMSTHDTLRDALIYSDMLNTDTNMIHRVFEEDDNESIAKVPDETSSRT